MPQKTLGDTLASVFSAYDPQRAVAGLMHKPTKEDYWRQRLSNQGSISNPQTSIGSLIADALTAGQKKLGVSERRAQHVTNRATSFLNDTTPVGNVTGAEEGAGMFGRGMTRGDLRQAAIGAGMFGLSVLPYAGKAKPVKNALLDLVRDESGAIRAWHGSPHDFDKFSMDKIGTGEGAQAYGHGLYFAENPAVAKEYQKQVWHDMQRAAGGHFNVPSSSSFKTTKGVIDGPGKPEHTAASLLSEMRAFQAQGEDVGLDWVKREIGLRGLNRHDNKVWSAVRKLKDEPLEKVDHFGRLYEVNINAEPEDFLDWDAPLNQQKVADVLGMSRRPEDAIHAEAERIMMAHPNGKWMEIPKLRARVDQLQAELDRRAPSLAGADFYRNTDPSNYLHSVLGGGNANPDRSGELLKQGIPGIRYLDQGSRNAADGTHNYVVFDDSLIDILGKY